MDPRDIGIKVTTPIVNIAAAGVANTVTLFTMPVLAGVLVGAKSAIIKKVIVDDNGTGGTQIHIGNGLGAGAFVALLPGLDVLTALLNIYGEDEIPAVESFANITAFVDAVGGSSVDVQLELLVRG